MTTLWRPWTGRSDWSKAVRPSAAVATERRSFPSLRIVWCMVRAVAMLIPLPLAGDVDQVTDVLRDDGYLLSRWREVPHSAGGGLLVGGALVPHHAIAAFVFPLPLMGGGAHRLWGASLPSWLSQRQESRTTGLFS